MNISAEIITALKNEFCISATAICVSGSISANLSTNTSDIDLVILKDDTNSDKIIAGDYIVKNVNGKLVEALVVDNKYVEDTIGCIHPKEINNHNFEEIKLAEKVISSKPIFGHEIWNSLLINIDRVQYQTALSFYHQRTAILHFDDAIGEISENQAFFAAFRLRKCVYHFVEALLSVLGDTNGREKWIIKRLRSSALGDSNFFNQFIKYYLQMPDPNSPNLENWMKEAIYFCNTLSASINSEILDKFRSSGDMTSQLPCEFSDLLNQEYLILSNIGECLIIKSPEFTEVVNDDLFAVFLERYEDPYLKQIMNR